MARKLIVEVVLDAAAYSKQVTKAQAETTRLTKGIGETSKQTTRAAVSFHGIGKSLAFATGGLVAFHSATEFIGESVDAAREAEVAQKALAAQMATSGESFDVMRSRIEDTTKSFAQFGFQNDEVIQSLTILDRGTGNIEEAMKLQGLAADIARAKNIDLSQAATVVSKVFGGQETALRRAVPGLDATAHGWDLIGAAQKRVAGQAAANTTASERFSATLHDTQELLGNLLLPTFDKALTRLTRFLGAFNQNSQAQQQTQQKTADWKKGLDVLTGGLKDATHWVDNLGGGIFTFHDAVNLARTDKWLVYFLSNIGKASKDAGVGIGSVTNAVEDMNKAIVGRARSGLGPPHPGTTGAHAPGADQPLPGATVEQRNAWFDQMIGRKELRAGLLTNLSAQIAAYQGIANLLQQQIGKIHDVTRKLNLKDQALQVAAQIAALVKQRQEEAIQNMIGGADIPMLRAQLTKSLTDDLAAAVLQGQLIQKAIQKYGQTKDLMLQAIQNQIDQQGIRDQIKEAARQDRLGWIQFAEEKAEATKTNKDNLKAYRAEEKFWLEMIKTSGRTLENVKGLWEVRQKIKDLNKKNVDADPLAGLFQVSSTRMASILGAGLGLDARGRAILGANIAGAEIQPLHVHVEIDGREIGRAVSKEQMRTSKRTAKQTSGRHG